MIEYSDFGKINHRTHEGMLVLSALAILTSLSQKDILSGRFGGISNPDSVFQEIVKLANKIYYEEEYKLHIISENRDNKINNIINGI